MYWRASSQLVKIGPPRALRTHAVQHLWLFLAVDPVQVECELVNTIFKFDVRCNGSWDTSTWPDDMACYNWICVLAMKASKKWIAGYYPERGSLRRHREKLYGVPPTHAIACRLRLLTSGWLPGYRLSYNNVQNIENDNRGYQPFRLFTNKIVYHTPVSAANDNEPIDYNYACNQNQYLQEHLQQHQPHQQHQLAVPTQ